MAITQVKSEQILDDGVSRADLNSTISGKAVIKKVVQGNGISISSSGVDSGTGDVTISESASFTGDKTVTGSVTSKINFQTELNEKIFGEDGAYIIIDPVNGTDGLDNDSYYANFSGTPTNKFQSWNAAIKWVNQLDRPTVYIEIINTTSVTPLVNSTNTSITGKSNVTIITGNANMQYIRLTANFFIYNSIVRSGKIEWQLYGNDYFRIGDNSAFYSNQNTFTPQSGVSLIIAITNGVFNFDLGVTTINFSANNQTLFHCSGNDGGKVIFSNHVGVGESFNVGAYTGLRWANNTPTRSLETWFVTTPSTSIPSSIDLSDSICYFGTTMGLRVTTYDASLFDYSLNLGGTVPLRFLDLNAGSSNLSHTTKKKLIVNEDGEVGVYDDTGSGGLSFAQIYSISTLNL